MVASKRHAWNIKCSHMKMNRIPILMVLGAMICGCISHRPLKVDDRKTLVALAKRLDSKVSDKMPLHELEKLFQTNGTMRVWARTSGYFQFALRPGLGVLAYCEATTNGFVLYNRRIEFCSDLSLRDGTPIRTRLSETNVLAIADALAVEKKRQYDGFDLKYYPERFPQIDIEGKKWDVLYWRVPNRWPGDHFTITVNDATGETKYFGGM